MTHDRLVVSFSGGRTSAFMTKWILDTWKDRFEIIVLFANTGKEREETLEFVNQCDHVFGFGTVWLETVMSDTYGVGAGFRVVTFETASRNGEPFEDVIRKHGIPNMKTPHCTRELKANPIKAYCRSIGWRKYYTAIGFRGDEPKRINRKKQKRDRHIYPLFDEFPITKEWINQYWRNQPFDLKLKNYEGNCDLCWKKNERKHLTIINEFPERADWWSRMEAKYEYFTPDTRKHNPKIQPPHRFFRGQTSVRTLMEKSKQYFEPAQDDTTREVYRQLLLYSNYGVEESKGCEESCEPF